MESKGSSTAGVAHKILCKRELNQGNNKNSRLRMLCKVVRSKQEIPVILDRMMRGSNREW